MLNKTIYDYEEFLEKINEILKKSLSNTFSISEIKNNWKTTCNLPIKHFAVGSGKKHIVLLGAHHGSEIITVEFLLYVMDFIAEAKLKLVEVLDEYTLDFIPIVNPEGYIITTSIIRKYISKNASPIELQKKCNTYKLAYIQDDLDENKLKQQGLGSNHTSIKNYQKLFRDYTWEDLPAKYYKIKENLKNLYQEHKIPNGAIIEWSANASGIDLNANSKYNKNISKIKDGQTLYMPYRNSNIICSEPGPK